jgi:hypothetical protein
MNALASVPGSSVGDARLDRAARLVDSGLESGAEIPRHGFNQPTMIFRETFGRSRVERYNAHQLVDNCQGCA